MNISHINPAPSQEVKEYDSSGAYILPIVETIAGANIHWLWFDPNSKIGYHKIESPLIYIVNDGEGWVRGDGSEPIDIQAGDIIYLDMGEWFEAGSETGMSLILIENRLPDIFSTKKAIQ